MIPAIILGLGIVVILMGLSIIGIIMLLNQEVTGLLLIGMVLVIIGLLFGGS